jgi:hypothetical protein
MIYIKEDMALLETNSTDFHPPINCNFEELKGKELKEQQEDRDKIVCVSGIDAHYKLNLLNEVDSSGKPTLQTFSPRMSSPSCPASYTGKFLTPDDEDDYDLREDCIKRSKTIGTKKPYRPRLYEKFEPRKKSKTVVIRDYVCKVPLDITNLSEVAKAVLVDYPDQYIQFLSAFVDNMFGEAMKRFLQNSWEKYETLKKDKEEINRVSWSFYSAMHKGGKYDDTTNKFDYAKPSGDNLLSIPDYTLQWDNKVIKDINGFNQMGRANTEQNTASDLIDLIPCLDHHIAVLKEMHAACKSFATSELHARLMMEYANMQGRNMCDDFMLIEDGETPEYRNVTLKVPISLFTEKTVSTGSVLDRSMDSTVRQTGNKNSEVLAATAMLDIPVGYFAGQIFNSGIRINSAYEAETRWGWGHPANVFQNIELDGGETDESKQFHSVPFYLPLSFGHADDNTMSVEISASTSQYTAGVFPSDEWSDKWSKQSVTKSVTTDKDLTLDSLLEGSRSEKFSKRYRQVVDFDKNTIRVEGAPMNSLGAGHLDNYSKRLSVDKRSGKDCKTGVSIVNVRPFGLVHPILLADKCIEYDGKKVLIPSSFLIPPALFNYNSKDNEAYNNLERNTSPGIMYLLGMIRSSEKIYPHLEGSGIEFEKPSNSEASNRTPALGNLTYRSTANDDSPYNPSDLEKYISSSLSTPDKLKEMKKALDGIGSFDRNVALVPGLPFSMKNMLTSTKSWRSKAVYRLSEPRALKVGVMMDSRMNNLEPRDKLICKISFLRYLLQYSFGMNTAALVYEELFTDHELIVLNWLDIIRHTQPSSDQANLAWWEPFMDYTVDEDGDRTSPGQSKEYPPINGTASSEPIRVNIKEMQKILDTLKIWKFLGIDPKLPQGEDPDDLLEYENHLLGNSSGVPLSKTWGEIYNRRVIDDHREDEIILKEMMKRITSRIEILLKHVDGKEGKYHDKTHPQLWSDHQIDDADLMRHFPGLYSRRALLKAQNDKLKLLAKLKTKIFSGTKYSDERQELIDDRMSRDTPTSILELALDNKVTYTVTSIDNAKNGYDKVSGAVLDALCDGAIQLTPGSQTTKSVKLHSGVKHFGSDTRALYDFMENNNEPMNTSCDTLNYINSVRPIRDKGEFENSESFEETMKHRYKTEYWSERSDNRDEEIKSELGEAGRAHEQNFDPLNYESMFFENTCFLSKDIQELLKDEAHDWRETKENGNQQAKQMPVLNGSMTWNAYKNDKEQRKKYLRPQPEIDYFRELDVRAAYCSTLTSFKDQVLNMAGGKLAPEFWMQEMSELCIVKACVKELKEKKVFTSQALGIMKTMLVEDGFMFESKTMKAFHEIETNQDRSESRFRSAQDGSVYNPYKTTITDGGTVFHIPYDSGRPTFDRTNTSLGSGPVPYEDLVPVSTTDNSHSFYPTTKGDMEQYFDKLYYNDVRSNNGAMLFSMMDAAGFAWDARKYSTPGENVRPDHPAKGHQDKMHYWSRIFVESFVNSREVHKAAKEATMPWEVAVRLFPDKCFKSTMIGGICDRSWKELFPLLSKHHALRAKLERIRSLSVMWYELKGYRVTSNNAKAFPRSEKGAWIPLPMSHQVHFMKRVGLYDEKNQIPVNPWTMREDGSVGLLSIFNQSYHSPWPMSPDSGYFKDWVKQACPYQLADEHNFRPFSQYGGHPVEADFVHHVIERPQGDKITEMRHSELVEQRYGNIEPIRMGKMFKDTGLLQNMFSYKYSPSAKAEKSQKDAYTDNVRISNFLAYARVHTIMALGSCNPGTQELSETRATRNFFRLHVDTYKCAGKEKNSDGVPVILGYIGREVKSEDEPPILFIAGTLNCINTQMSKFCYSAANKGEKICPMYKQLYLNDATILFEKLLRQERTRHRHAKNFAKVRMKDPTFTKTQFDAYMLDLKEEHISFLQHIIIGMLQQLGLTDKELPLGILEPRDFYVDPTETHDTDLVGNDYLSPSTLESIDGIDFASDEIDYTQLSVLSLTPPDVRAIAMMKLNQFPEEVDTEYLKSQVQQKVIKENKDVWKNYAKKVVQAGLGAQWLEGHHISLAFDPDQFKDPVAESERIGIKKTSSLKLRDSELSLRKKSEDLRKVQGSTSASSRLTAEHDRALAKLDNEIKGAAEKHGSSVLTELASRDDIPDSIKRKLARMYMA